MKPDLFKSLTPKELKIINLILDGQNTVQISYECEDSSERVRYMIKVIFKKIALNALGLKEKRIVTNKLGKIKTTIYTKS